MSWIDLRRSDWVVKLGERDFNLHTVILSRESTFFAGNVDAVLNGQLGDTRTRCSDITDVVPQCCHSVFEEALEFSYSRDQPSFKVPIGQAMLLLKLATVLDMPGLASHVCRCIETHMGTNRTESISSVGIGLLTQYLAFHIRGTDDGHHVNTVENRAVQVIADEFSLIAQREESEDYAWLCRCPEELLVTILRRDDLKIATEDDVLAFLLARAKKLSCDPRRREENEVKHSRKADAGFEDKVWESIRWGHVGDAAWRSFTRTLAFRRQFMSMAMAADDIAIDLDSPSTFKNNSSDSRRRGLQPDVVCGPFEIQFWFYFGDGSQFPVGKELRSHPKMIGQIPFRLLVYPGGGFEAGHMSVYVEVADVPRFPPTWNTSTELTFKMECTDPTGAYSNVKDLKLAPFGNVHKAWGFKSYAAHETVLARRSEAGFIGLRLSLVTCGTMAPIIPLIVS